MVRLWSLKENVSQAHKLVSLPSLAYLKLSLLLSSPAPFSILANQVAQFKTLLSDLKVIQESHRSTRRKARSALNPSAWGRWEQSLKAVPQSCNFEQGVGFG